MGSKRGMPATNAIVYTCQKCKGQIWLAQGIKRLRCKCGGLLRDR